MGHSTSKRALLKHHFIFFLNLLTYSDKNMRRVSRKRFGKKKKFFLDEIIDACKLQKFIIQKTSLIRTLKLLYHRNH